MEEQHQMDPKAFFGLHLEVLSEAQVRDFGDSVSRTTGLNHTAASRWEASRASLDAIILEHKALSVRSTLGEAPDMADMTGYRERLTLLEERLIDSCEALREFTDEDGRAALDSMTAGA